MELWIQFVFAVTHFGVNLETFFAKVDTSECRCRISIEISTLKERKKKYYVHIAKKKTKRIILQQANATQGLQQWTASKESSS